MSDPFPICLVSALHGDAVIPVTPIAGYVAAFSNVQNAAEYMFQRGHTQWTMTLVSRPTFAETIFSLKMLGLKGFAFNPVGQETGKLMDFQAV